MQLLSCENPQKVFNKYINDYVYVPCGKCNICKNAKAARWTDALERERLYHHYCFFVTLTYSDENLPLMNLGFFPNFNVTSDTLLNLDLVSSKHDDFCIPFKSLKSVFSDDGADEDLFFGLYRQFNGIPYASVKDLQYFHKRLNKYFYDHVTKKFKNFRYFCVSEFGTTTMRPHFHGVYYVDRKDVAQRFAEAIGLSWQQGITDCQFVEKSACSYVAQYINKFADLPSFYKTRELSPKYVFSKFPTIGQQDFSDTLRASTEYTTSLQTLFDSATPTICCREKADSTKFVVRPLDRCTQNRLYPKCPSFSQVSDTCRVELYNVAARFVREGKRTFKGFIREVTFYLGRIYCDPAWDFRLCPTELSDLLYEKFYKGFVLYRTEDERKASIEWLRRLYYISQRVLKQACIFKVSLLTYVRRIIQYYNNKDLYLLKTQYEYESRYTGEIDNLACLYPNYIFDCGFRFSDFIKEFKPQEAMLQIKDAAYFAFSNKKTHFKNGYLDSLKYKETYKNLFNTLKLYFHAKECNETLEAFAS